MVLYLADAISHLFDTSYLTMPLTLQKKDKKVILQHWRMELITQWLSTNSHHSCREGMLLLDELGHLRLATKLKAKCFFINEAEKSMYKYSYPNRAKLGSKFCDFQKIA